MLQFYDYHYTVIEIYLLSIVIHCVADFHANCHAILCLDIVQILTTNVRVIHRSVSIAATMSLYQQQSARKYRGVSHSDLESSVRRKHHNFRYI